MIRIGIIGTENSHAMAFTKLLNTKNPADSLDAGARVVAVHAKEAATAQKIVDEVDATIEHLKDPADFFGKVDAMMITCRRGSEHYGYAKPFLEKGIPMFIDKPFTSDPEEARKMIAVAEKYNAPIAGGSSLRHCPEVIAMRDEIAALREKDALLGGAVQYPADETSIYDGFYFYSPHLVESMLTAFGPKVKSVQAFRGKNGITAVARYDDIDVSMHFASGSHKYSGTIYGKEQNSYREFSLGNVYAAELNEFLQVVRTRKTAGALKNYVLPVLVIDAILKSADSGKPVEICL